MPKRMAITRASKLFFVGVIFVLLVSHVLGHGGGGGQGGGDRGNTRGGGGVDKGGGVSSTKDGRTSSQSNISSSVSTSTSIAHGASLSNSTMSSPPDARTTTSTSASTSGGGASSTDGSIIYFPSQYTAECDHYGEDAHYAVRLSGTVRQAWSDTGCPNHVNWGVDKGPDYHFPGRIVPSNISIPAYPMLIGDGGTTDLSVTNGQVAILVNGVAMFSAWATRPVTDYNSTAFYLEGDTLDACGGHATTEGWYHYHGTPGCLEEQVMAGEGLTMDDHSPFLGWSYDGFPMYGHLGPSGTEMRACDTHGADETYCLDTCSGYEGEMPDIDSFTYRYYLTCGYDESFFPMTINCFRGCCPDGMECNAIVELCDEMTEPGYTSSYEPEVGYNYTDVYELEVLSGDDSKYINSSTVANCTMFYNETLKYTVQQISIEDYPIAPTTPSPASSGRGAGNTHGPTPSSVVSSEAPVHGFISSLQESPTTTPGGALTTASPIIPSAI